MADQEDEIQLVHRGTEMDDLPESDGPLTEEEDGVTCHEDQLQ